MVSSFLRQKALPVAEGGLIVHRCIVRRGFVMLHPSSIDECEASLVHQQLDSIPGLFRLLLPPTCEERLQDVQYKLRISVSLRKVR